MAKLRTFCNQIWAKKADIHKGVQKGVATTLLSGGVQHGHVSYIPEEALLL